jgi:hypothetical protein
VIIGGSNFTGGNDALWVPAFDMLPAIPGAAREAEPLIAEIAEVVSGLRDSAASPDIERSPGSMSKVGIDGLRQRSLSCRVCGRSWNLEAAWHQEICHSARPTWLLRPESQTPESRDVRYQQENTRNLGTYQDINQK